MKKKKQDNPNLREIRINARVNQTEMRIILANAHAVCEGNVSRYVRLAILNYKPTKK